VDTNSYDYGTIYCRHCGGKNESPFIAPEVIGDFILFGDRGVIVLEAKSTGKEYFPIRNIKNGQISTSLILNSYRSVDYFFAINDRRNRRRYRLFLISADELDDAIADIQLKSRLTWDEITPKAEELERMKKGLWDLRPLLIRLAVYRGKEEGIQNESGGIRWNKSKEARGTNPHPSSLLIRILEDTGPFTSWNGENITLKKEEIANIPYDFARIMIDMGNAEVIKGEI